VTHPEFGYAGTSGFRRGFIAFVICGLVAGGSGIAMFKGNPDPDPAPDPMKAMALAPVETFGSTTGSTLTEIAGRNSGELLQQTPAIKPHCRNTATEHFDDDCITDQTRRPRSIRALNERPAIAAVPIGHLEPPIPSGSAIPVAVIPETTADSASPADVAPVVDTAPAVMEAPAPAVSAKKTQPRGNRVQRRDRNEYSHSSSYTNRHYKPTYNSYYQSGYARLW
jgi:hypothetical protein